MSHTGGVADPTLAFAFAAGLTSFLSPCVLPVIPGFLAHLGGTTLNTDEDGISMSRKKVFLSSVAFVVGFSLVFGVLGVVLNSVLRDMSSEILIWLSRVAGAVIIAFGLQITGIVELEFLETERGFNAVDRMEPSYLTSFVFGGAFAVGWTPCVGPLLGSVLSLAVTRPVDAFPLLMGYSVGLGVPFLVVGALPIKSRGVLDRFGRKIGQLRVVFGYILILLGVLVFTNKLSLIANSEFLVRLIS